MDTSFMIDSASAMVVVRPAAIFSRPEFAPLAMLLERSSIWIPGTRLADFRQITIIEPVPAYSEIMVFQGVKPIADECLMQLMPDKKYTISDYHGKKMYRSSYGNRVILKYDDRTIVTCRTEQSLGVYNSAKRGTLPKWLPARAWESLRGNDYVIVADMTVMRPELEKMVYRYPAIVQAAFASVSRCGKTPPRWRREQDWTTDSQPTLGQQQKHRFFGKTPSRRPRCLRRSFKAPSRTLARRFSPVNSRALQPSSHCSTWPTAC